MLQKEKAWESLIWIVVWIFILSIVILGIWKLISYSTDLTDWYTDATNLRILKNNLSHIIIKLDTSQILENEIFYIHKDNTTHEFKVLTWSTNVRYKYIDVYGNTVDNPLTFEKDIYARFLYIKREDTALNSQNQIIWASITKLIKK